MDGRRFIKAMFSSDKGQKVTQVVMNLPKDAAESLGLNKLQLSASFFLLTVPS